MRISKFIKENQILKKLKNPIELSPKCMVCFLLIIILTSCNGTGTPQPPESQEEEQLYYDVPYIPQPEGSKLCGVAAGIMILNYYGEKLSMDNFGPNITGDDGKLDISEFSAYVTNNGYSLDPFNIDKSLGIDKVIEVLERGPVMVVQKYSLTDEREHSRVLIGYNKNKEEIISHDPSRGKDFKIRYDNFFDLSVEEQCCYFFEIRPETDKTTTVSLNKQKSKTTI